MAVRPPSTKRSVPVTNEASRTQETGCRRRLLRAYPAAWRMVVLAASPDTARGSSQRGGAALVKGREDGPRTDGIHPDPVSRVSIAIPRVSPATAALVVSYCVVLPTLVTDRTDCDVDDAAAAALSHDRDRRLRAERVALEVHTEDLVPALGAGLDHRVIQPDPGVVDEDVEPAEALRACRTNAAASASRSMCASTNIAWPPPASISRRHACPGRRRGRRTPPFAPSARSVAPWPRRCPTHRR